MSKRYKIVPDYKEMTHELNKTTNKQWKTIAKGLYYTGARASELIEIRTKDIWQDEENSSFINVRLNTKKNRKSHQRIVPINSNIEPDGATLFLRLKNNIDDNTLVFQPPFTNTKTFLREMRRRINEYYDGVAPHYFRHCRLTHMVTKFNYNEQELIQYAGWTDSRPAGTYMHLNVRNLQNKMKGNL